METSLLNDDLALKTLRWGLVLTGFLILVFRHRSFLDRSGLLREMALVIFAYFAYFAVRGTTMGSEARAVANAEKVVGFERAIGLFREPAMQDAILDNRGLVNLMNWMYVWGHWPLIILVAAWLFLNHQSTYRLYRNAFLISGAIGLVIFALFPVAPPRLADIDIVDTVTLHSNSYRVLQPPGLVNQYAAVPSLHFGWNLLIGIVLFTRGRSVVTRATGLAVPPVMFLAIVLTANHYIIDAVLGGMVALTGLAIAYGLMRAPEYGEPSMEHGDRAGGHG
jgi:PAP2 superfamily protein